MLSPCVLAVCLFHFSSLPSLIRFRFGHRSFVSSCLFLVGNMLSPRSTFQRDLMVYRRDGIDRKTGRNGKTIVKTESCSRLIPSRRPCHLPLTRTVTSRRGNLSRYTLQSRSVEEIYLYRLVPSTKPAPTIPSRLQNRPPPYRPSSKPSHTVSSCRQNLSLPSSPAATTCPYRPAPPFNAITPCRQDVVAVKMM